MFQYTHELVLNNPVIKKVDGKVIIERGGEYKPAFVQDGKIYKTVAVEGKLDKVILDVAALNLEAGKNYAINMFVKLVDPHALFEYGYPNYNSFGKQILIDFKSASAAADAQMILDSILPQVMENDLTFVKGEVSGSKVTLEVGHTGLRFDSMAVAEYDTTACDSCIGEYLAPKIILDRMDWAAPVNNKINGSSELGAAIEHAVVGVDPFATGQWLIENLRFPSYPNIRWAAIGEENRPIAGEKYVMYSFAYEAPRPSLGGLSGVGQGMTAVTRHIYYVREDKAAAFEAVLAELGTITASSNYAE